MAVSAKATADLLRHSFIHNSPVTHGVWRAPAIGTPNQKGHGVFCFGNHGFQAPCRDSADKRIVHADRNITNSAVKQGGLVWLKRKRISSSWEDC